MSFLEVQAIPLIKNMRELTSDLCSNRNNSVFTNATVLRFQLLQLFIRATLISANSTLSYLEE